MSLPLPSGHVLEPTAVTLVEHTGESSGSSTLRNRGGSEDTAGPFVASPSPEAKTFFDEKDQRDRPPTVFVPPENKHRCLILCFDGTGDQFDADNSNIVQLVSAMKKDDRTKQMVYYQSGIGTYMSPKVANPLLTKISLTLDAAIAWNLDAHVMGGYEFLMQNYTAGDRICIFGFSRGAYIARSLAGMIHKVGLLPVDNHQQVPFAYRIYARADAAGWTQSNAFKKAFSNDVHIDFIGVWDTVNSVGLIPKRLPFTTSNTIVRTFRHAVSLDERRAKFKANLWNVPTDKEKKLGTHTPPVAPTLQHKPLRHGFTLPMAKIETRFKNMAQSDDEDEQEQTEFEEAFSKSRKTRPTDVLEVWFAGCHCDVGGGSVANDTRHSLARIPLRWMIRECFKADTGIIFDARRLQELGLDPATLYPFVLPRPPPLPLDSGHKLESIPPRKGWLRRTLSRKHKADNFPVSPELESLPLPKPVRGMEEEEDLKDSLQPIYDQLQLKPFWWILEILPLTFRYQKSDSKWVAESRANFGRPRHIPHQRPHEGDPQYDAEEKPAVNLKVHRSVKTRKEARDAKGRSYVNRAHFHTEPEWVD
ncbi:hypothetical protein K438DRAFT_1801131 [Mycena galopus ATCC 62051]|nr:hypothetical protein K438DRAFT_1801131 [Mycena galopus ATCC 62051]